MIGSIHVSLITPGRPGFTDRSQECAIVDDSVDICAVDITGITEHQAVNPVLGTALTIRDGGPCRTDVHETSDLQTKFIQRKDLLPSDRSIPASTIRITITNQPAIGSSIRIE